MKMEKDQVFTLTFGDRCENHAGMQRLGKEADTGFTLTDLQQAKTWFEERGIECSLLFLNEHLPEGENADDAWFLVARVGVRTICSPADLFQEQEVLEKDKKALMRGRVVNKKARHNLCFAEEAQEAEYEKGKGTIVAFDSVPLLKKVRETLPEIMGEKARNLYIEGNYYYDLNKCYINFHGDSERRRVVGVRIGADFPLHFMWFKEGEQISKRMEILLSHGDIYIMSEKTVGKDWKRRKITTLRHAAGLAKTLKFDEENVVKL